MFIIYKFTENSFFKLNILKYLISVYIVELCIDYPGKIILGNMNNINNMKKDKLKHLFIQVLMAALININSSAFSQAYESGNSAGPVQDFAWPEGKKMALSLTFDDARLSQPDT